MSPSIESLLQTSVRAYFGGQDFASLVDAVSAETKTVQGEWPSFVGQTGLVRAPVALCGTRPVAAPEGDLAIMAVDTLKDLFLSDLLPDRKLSFFHEQAVPADVGAGGIEELRFDVRAESLFFRVRNRDPIACAVPLRLAFRFAAVERPTEPDDTPADADKLEPGQSLSSNLFPGGDRDHHDLARAVRRSPPVADAVGGRPRRQPRCAAR